MPAFRRAVRALACVFALGAGSLVLAGQGSDVSTAPDQAPVSADAKGTSTRPYLIRALYDWCRNNSFTPYVAVYVDASVHVPMEYVKNHEIVLNIGPDATEGLRLGNEYIEFEAYFNSVKRRINLPVDHVVAIYARENGQGMSFPAPGGEAASASGQAASAPPVTH